MTTTTSFSNFDRFRAMVCQDLRRVRSLTLFYWTLSFLFFPLQYILEILNGRHTGPGGNSFYSLAGPGEIYNVASYLIFFPLVIVLSIVMASQLISYMQNKRAVDVYHALPVSRVQMMGAHFTAGMLALGVPLLLNFGIVMSVKTLSGNAPGMGQVATECLYWLITLFVIFSITAFAAVNVGTLFDTIIFSLFLSGIVPCLYLMCVGIFSSYLYGYVANLDPLLYMSPVILLILHQQNPFAVGASDTLQLCQHWFVIWFFIGVLIMALTIFLYARRKSELAESVNTTGALKLLVKFSGTFLGSLLIGLLFMGIFSGDGMGSSGFYENRYFILGSVLGAFVTYLVAEAVLARGFKTIRHNIPALLCSMAFMGIFTYSVCSGGFGFANHLPKLSDIQSVTINYTGLGGEESVYQDVGPGGHWRNNDHPESVTLSSPEAKEIVLRLHQEQLKEWSRLDGQQDTSPSVTMDDRWGGLSLDYNLGGLHLKREYNVLYNQASNVLLELEACPEFIEKTTPLLGVKADNVSEITFYNALGEDKGPLNLDDEDTQRLLSAIETDLFAQTTADFRDRATLAYASLSFDLKGIPSVHTGSGHDYRELALVGTQINLYPSFSNTLSLLREKNLDVLSSYDLSSCELACAYLQTYAPGSSQSVVDSAATFRKNPHQYPYYASAFTTTDPSQIAQLVGLGQSRIYPDQPYVVLGIYLRGEPQPDTEDAVEEDTDIPLTEEAPSSQPQEDLDNLMDRSPDCIFFLPVEKAPDYLLKELIESDSYNSSIQSWLTQVLEKRAPISH